MCAPPRLDAFGASLQATGMDLSELYGCSVASSSCASTSASSSEASRAELRHAANGLQSAPRSLLSEARQIPSGAPGGLWGVDAAERQNGSINGSYNGSYNGSISGSYNG